MSEYERGVREERARVARLLCEELCGGCLDLVDLIERGEHAAESGAEDGPEKTGASTDVHERKCPHDWYMRGSCKCGLGLDGKTTPKAKRPARFTYWVIKRGEKYLGGETDYDNCRDFAVRFKTREHAMRATTGDERVVRVVAREPEPKAKRPAKYWVLRRLCLVNERGEYVYRYVCGDRDTSLDRKNAKRFTSIVSARVFRDDLNDVWRPETRIVKVVAREKGRGA